MASDRSSGRQGLPDYDRYEISDPNLVSKTISKGNFRGLPQPITVGVVLTLYKNNVIVDKYESHKVNNGVYVYRRTVDTQRVDSRPSARSRRLDAIKYMDTVLRRHGYGVPIRSRDPTDVTVVGITNMMMNYFERKKARNYVNKSTATLQELWAAFDEWIRGDDGKTFIDSEVIPSVDRVYERIPNAMDNAGSDASWADVESSDEDDE